MYLAQIIAHEIIRSEFFSQKTNDKSTILIFINMFDIKTGKKDSVHTSERLKVKNRRMTSN